MNLAAGLGARGKGVLLIDNDPQGNATQFLGLASVVSEPGIYGSKVFALDVLARPECGSRLQIIAFIAQPKVAHRILDHLGFDSTGPPLARAQAKPEVFDLGPDYAVPDPTCS